jgi:hypothetical protein
MSFDQYIPTLAIQKAVRGRETEVLRALNIAWDDGAKHLTCPSRITQTSIPRGAGTGTKNGRTAPASTARTQSLMW